MNPLLLTTITHRPYVFCFLFAYLFLAWRAWGWRRAIWWLVSGYLIAWASEASSIHNGFPYGEYHYIYENMPGELMVLGVPFFDSLSYPFLIFAGFSVAEFLSVKKLHVHIEDVSQSPLPLWERVRVRGIFLACLGALLTMLLDVIIDPVATMGDKWFLGKIHWYAHPGFYFGVPLTNFAGWFIVSLAVIVTNNIIWRIFPAYFKVVIPASKVACHAELGSASLENKGILNQVQDDKQSFLTNVFYISIALFNIVITFWIGEWKLGLASLAVILAVGLWIVRKRSI